MSWRQLETGEAGEADIRDRYSASIPFWMSDEHQFRGRACFLQIAITARPAAIIDYCVSPWEKITLTLFACALHSRLPASLVRGCS